MNKIFSVILTFLLACTATTNEEGYQISGMLENTPNGGKVFFEKVTETGNQPLDTAQVTEGRFELYVNPKLIDPSFYTLNINNRQKIALILTGKEEKVVVNADGNDPRGFVEVSGSEDTDYKLQMDEIMKSYQQEMEELQGRQRQARMNQDVSTYQQLNDEIQSYALATEQKLKNKILEAAPSLAAYYGIQMIQVENNVEYYDSIVSILNKAYPDNYLVRDLAQKVQLSRSLAVGAQAPEIALPNPEGEILSLSSLRGNYVLIDFWAAWCRPCRVENPNVVKVYQEYSDKNFEILGVSLDKTKSAWLQAIEQDGLPWLHISDLKYWRNEAAQTYQVKAIPATYLIDPEGKIIAKNLRGASLEAKLKEIFG